MSVEEAINEEVLDRAKNLVDSLESGKSDQAHGLLDELTRLHEQSLFQELGKLTREFHDALNSFRGDQRLAQLAGEDIPDAKERLKHVIKMTDEAAHTTLNVVEDAIPKCANVETVAADIRNRWERFTRREMDAQEFRELSKELDDFLGGVVEDMGGMRSGLNEVLMAQGYQDLTGQIITRVITLVGDLETSLVDLIRISGQRQPAEKEDDAGKLDGPQVPGIESDTAVSGQDEVDDLLSSLGF